MVRISPSPDKPGIPENIISTFTNSNHLCHLFSLFFIGINLRIPVCHLGYPDLLAVFFQAVELGCKTVVIPVESQVVNLRLSALIGGFVSGVKSIEPDSGSA